MRTMSREINPELKDIMPYEIKVKFKDQRKVVYEVRSFQITENKVYLGLLGGGSCIFQMPDIESIEINGNEELKYAVFYG